MSRTHFSLDPIEGLPRPAQAKILEMLKSEDLEKGRRINAFCDGQDRLCAEYKEKLQALVGAAHIDVFRRIKDRHREKQAALLKECGLGPEGLKKREDIRNETRAALDQLAVEAKWDLKAFRALRILFRDKAKAAFAEYMGNEPPADNRPKIKNHDYYPPFLGGFHSEYSYISPGPYRIPPTTIGWEDPARGIMSALTSASLYDASDSEWSFAFSDSGLIHWHIMGGAGRVQVQVEFQNVETRNWGAVWDERGWSELYAYQRFRLYARLLYPFDSGYAFSREGDFAYEDTDNEDHSWSFQRYVPGNIINYQVALGPTLPANSIIVVMVGVQAADYFWTNDTSVNTNMVSRLRVRRVGIFQS